MKRLFEGGLREVWKRLRKSTRNVAAVREEESITPFLTPMSDGASQGNSTPEAP